MREIFIQEENNPLKLAQVEFQLSKTPTTEL